MSNLENQPVAARKIDLLDIAHSIALMHSSPTCFGSHWLHEATKDHALLNAVGAEYEKVELAPVLETVQIAFAAAQLQQRHLWLHEWWRQSCPDHA